jgi:5-methylcytosine-specific restriction protein A
MLEDAGYTIIIKSASAAEADRRKRRAAHSKAETDKAVASVPADPEERRWIEGNPRIATHLRTERTRSLKAAASKRIAVRAANDGRLACEHCATDWYAVYPHAIAEAIFDIHHTIPLSDMGEDHQTCIEDLVCLCANCHRAEHRRMALG